MAPSVVTRVAFKNILFATDFSEVSQHALLHALAMAKRFDARLTVVHVAPPEAQVPIPMAVSYTHLTLPTILRV